LENKRKIPKNISRCVGSNSVKNIQILVCLLFFAGVRGSTGQNFLLFSFLVELVMPAKYNK
jgi:hypothetical protein